MYINIHTHQAHDNDVEIINLFPEELGLMIPGKYYSVGIHPWDVSTIEIEKHLEIVEKSATIKNVLAIGEIGLDKFKPLFELQYSVFLKQIEIAESYCKAIIIHCVKAYSELIEILNKKKINVPIIIHRYSGNKTIAEQLIRYGCYLSFGHELYRLKSKTPQVFKPISLQHLFLESDDSDKSIQDIYLYAGQLKNVSEETLYSALLNNFQSCFNFNPFA